MKSNKARVLALVVSLVIVLSGLIAPGVFAAEKKLSLRERLAISKVIDAYAKSGRSKSACWSYSRPTRLENG